MPNVPLHSCSKKDNVRNRSSLCGESERFVITRELCLKRGAFRATAHQISGQATLEFHIVGNSTQECSPDCGLPYSNPSWNTFITAVFDSEANEVSIQAEQ